MRNGEDSEELLGLCERQQDMLRMQRERMQTQKERIRRQHGVVTDYAAEGVEPLLDDSPAEVERVVRELLKTV